MKLCHCLVAAAVCAVVLAQPTQAQGGVTAGQTVSGRLDASDYIRDDGTYYDDWFYEGRAGERIVVTQSSGDFDSWLLIGRVVNGDFQLDEYDDDGAGGNDSRITYDLPADGRYVIRVNVVGRGRTGSYTLRIDRSGGSTVAASPTGGRVLAAGQSFAGELDPSDPLWTDDTHYELWRYYGRAGERLSITMRSSAFNSYMQFGRINGNEFNYLEGSNGRTIGGQHETVLDVTLSETGEYGIRANSHGRRTGSYVIAVSSSGASGSSKSSPATRSSGTIFAGSTTRGSLQASDLQADSGWYHDDYTFSGSRGDVIYVDLVASDFDAYVDIYQGSTWAASDDDGGEGLNSRLVYTLPETGSYTICARSRYANKTGAYSLSLQTGGGQAISSSAGGYVGLNQSVTGQLDASDPTIGDGTYYDLWRFSGQAGQRLRIILRSSDFDAYLAFGTMSGGSFSSVETNDDGGGGTDAMIDITVTASGEYAIRANSLSKATGRYTLTVQTR